MFPALLCFTEELQCTLHAALDGKEFELLKDSLQQLECQAVIYLKSGQLWCHAENEQIPMISKRILLLYHEFLSWDATQCFVAYLYIIKSDNFDRAVAPSYKINVDPEGARPPRVTSDGTSPHRVPGFEAEY